MVAAPNDAVTTAASPMLGIPDAGRGHAYLSDGSPYSRTGPIHATCGFISGDPGNGILSFPARSKIMPTCRPVVTG